MEGFERLWQLSLSARRACGHAEDVIGALGVAFLAFQEAHPRLLELMYESELTRPVIDPTILLQQGRGYALICDVVGDSVPSLPAATVRARAIAFWSAIYGFASLTGKGLLQPVVADDGEIALWRETLIEQAVAAVRRPCDTAAA